MLKNIKRSCLIIAYIYKITNNINGKIYIGKTEFSVEKRFKEHCRDAFKERCEKRPLYSAINKYGIENFTVETIEETDNPEEREKYWIEYYGSFKNGYNATMGGDGKKYADYELILSLFNEGKTEKEIYQITGYTDKTIRAALVQGGVSQEDRQARGVATRSKPVVMLDKNTLKILKVFPSAREAERYLNKPNGNRHINEVCNGKRQTAYGYKWRHLK